MPKKPAKTRRAKRRERCLASSATAATPKAEKAAGATPHLSDQEVLELLRRTSLNGFPNPDRKGCPSGDVIGKLALHTGEVSIADPVIHHVTHCSPCFAEIQRLRARNKETG